MMDAATGSKREKHKYARAVEIDDSLVQKITEDYERGVFKSSLQSTHQSKRRLLWAFSNKPLCITEQCYKDKLLKICWYKNLLKTKDKNHALIPVNSKSPRTLPDKEYS